MNKKEKVGMNFRELNRQDGRMSKTNCMKNDTNHFTVNNNYCSTVNNENIVIPGGEDTVHISFYCGFTERFRNCLREIVLAKRIAQNPQKGTEENEAPQAAFECGENIYAVAPEGFAPSKNAARFCYYRYKLKDGGITIGLSTRKCASDSVSPNVRVEIGALPLILAGSLDNLYGNIKQRLADLGLVVLKNRLARVDPCVDLPVSVSKLQHAILDRRFKTRARSMSMWVTCDNIDEAEILPQEFPDEGCNIALHFKGMSCTGFSVGKDKVMCRGYDKLAKEKHNEEMMQALAQRRFNDELPENVMRIEFQLRRDALRGMCVIGYKDGIETVEDWLEYKGAITRYLCMEWLVFTEEAFDRTHSDRIELDDFHRDWIKAVNAFKRSYGKDDRKVKRLKKSIKRESKEHLAQSIGCDQSALLRSDMPFSRYDPQWIEKFAAFRYLSTFRILGDKDAQDSFWQNWQDKELLQEASIPEESLSDILPEAIRGACVTHTKPIDKIVSALLMPAGASGPAPSVIS